eukprot:TRINITY_DN57324_c0_g1_i1.p1 TRINITY_DN57324_c0_g1~~TRINITY_DN57324_c0_g1_i1.p1  ORF type:complete len:222 (+),score=27.14 TRINITY_DN57324_c0_g1_i1:65-730(+)
MCEPAWYVAGKPCPSGVAVYPFAGVASFTWPSNPEPLDYIAAFYSGYVQTVLVFLGPILLVILAAPRRGASLFALALSVFTFLQSIANTGMKNILLMPRPSGSCLASCDMPSGHAQVSIGIATFILLETYTRPIAWTYKRMIEALVVIFMLPMPWSRVQLQDHSIPAVIAGSCLGVLLTLAIFAFLRRVAGPCLPGWQTCVLVDDYSLAEASEVRTLAKAS